MKARRMIAAILGVLMILGVFQVSASAAGRTPFGMIDQYAGDSFDVLDNEDAFEALYYGCITHKSSVNLYQYNIPVSEIEAVFDAFLSVYPEIFFVERSIYYSFTYSSAIQNNIIYDFYLTYTVDDKEESDEMLTAFYAKADEYLALVKDPSMDEFTKALILHDALVLNSRYVIPNSTNYTFMVEGWGRCENYAECYAYLLAQIGIESEIINSDVMNHEWMKIRLNGSDYYYNVDVTWDDPTTSQTENGDMPGRVSHTFFLLSDDLIQDEDVFDEEQLHYYYEYINGSDGTYDNYSNLHSLKNPLFYIDGELYTIYEGVYEHEYYGELEVGYIATYNHENDTFTDLYMIEDWWLAGGDGFWNGNFSGIGADNGLLYYNGDNCVYCYDPETGESTMYIDSALSDGRHLYGMYIMDGKIYGKAASSPNANSFEFVELGETKKPYTVTITDGIQNGTVTADKASAFEGKTVTLTVSPDKGYDVESVYVNNDELEPVGDVYSFEMPDENVLVTASFIEGEPMAGHSISLNGDIGLNFYYNLTEEQAENRTVTFTWTVKGKEQAAACELKEDEKTNLYKASCPIPAAEMTAEVTATLTIGEEKITDSFSVADYAMHLLSEDYRAVYLASNHTEAQYNKLAELVKTMLYYGARAQERFSRDTEHLADAGIEYTPGNVTPEMINTGASDMNEGLNAYGLHYEGSTLVFLSRSSLRHYYTVVGDDFESVKNNITFGGNTPIIYGEKGGQIYFELENIAAAKLDELFSLKIGAAEYKYSALDYVKACLQGDVSEKMKALAAATYLYNQAANAYFEQ